MQVCPSPRCAKLPLLTGRKNHTEESLDFKVPCTVPGHGGIVASKLWLLLVGQMTTNHWTHPHGVGQQLRLSDKSVQDKVPQNLMVYHTLPYFAHVLMATDWIARIFAQSHCSICLTSLLLCSSKESKFFFLISHMAMDQYLLIPFLGE